jgi:uncharacterized protein YodC (DUF2158 family)
MMLEWVQLNSGGPPMIVVHVFRDHNDDLQAVCAWDYGTHYNIGQFAWVCLTPLLTFQA